MFTSKKNKKGAIQGQGIVIGVMLLVLIIAIMGIVTLFLYSMLSNMATTGNLDGGNVAASSYGLTTSPRVNETITSVTEKGKNLTVSSLSGVTCTILQVTNQTDGIAIPAANRTTTNCQLRYSGVQGMFNNTNWNVTYTYDYVVPSTQKSAVTGAISNGSVAIGSVFQYMNIIVLVGVLVLIILLVGVILFVIFRFSGNTGGRASEPAI